MQWRIKAAVCALLVLSTHVQLGAAGGATIPVVVQLSAGNSCPPVEPLDGTAAPGPAIAARCPATAARRLQLPSDRAAGGATVPAVVHLPAGRDAGRYSCTGPAIAARCPAARCPATAGYSCPHVQLPAGYSCPHVQLPSDRAAGRCSYTAALR